MLKPILLLALLVSGVPSSAATGFGFVGNWLLKSVALDSCSSHLKPYVSKIKERELCGCAWNYVISTKGEAAFVLTQVMQHKKNKKWQAVEKQQILTCVARTNETKTLTDAEKHNIKLARWMNISSR